MPDFNSPIELVGLPECEMWLLDYSETPYGSLDDHGVNISIDFVTAFRGPDGWEGTYNCYEIPIRDLQSEEAAEYMLRAGLVPNSLIISPSLAPSVEEILSAARHLACHRPPSLTLLRLIVCLYLPVNRVPNRDDYREFNDDHYNEDSTRFVPESDDNDEGADWLTQAIDAIRNSLDYLSGRRDEDDEGDENAIGFVPASEESIKGLEKVRVKNESGFDMECSVCLEELEVDSEATRLPCSHLFHGDCILKWLNTSRICPLCRFELTS